MVATFTEHRRKKQGEQWVRKTTDYVAEEETSETHIIPDAAFILENVQTKKRGLFLVEMDRATERIVSAISRTQRLSLHHRMEQYDRYLKSLRDSQTDGQDGDAPSCCGL